ncbi:unnamed protein product, partial [Durusdinium trenchii]
GHRGDTLQVLGHPACQQAYKRLLRLGSDRFARLSTAVRNGDIDCPLDLRYSTREFTAWTDKRQIVHDFLHELHTTLAEPMPESRCCSKRPRLIKKRDDKIIQRATGMVEKALPPGSFCEYLAMLRSKHPGLKCSYKLFTTAAASEFARMIRPKLTATAIICHGRDTMVHLSVPGVHSDSSHSIELIARMLERLRERNVDGCGPELLIQGDNGPKEIKNNALVRYLSMLVCHGKLRRAEIHEGIGSLIANFAKLPSCWSRIVSTLPSITSTLCPLTLAVVMSDQTNLTSRWLWWTESVTGI